MKCVTMLVAGTALAGLAYAGPITSSPPVIAAVGGDVVAVYVYADAADASFLSLATVPAVNPIFCNAAISGTCSGSNLAGDTVDLGSRNGLLTFTLTNTTTGFSYDSANPDSDGNYHVKVSANYADFGVGSLPAGAASAVAGMSSITFIGFEDLQLSTGSDWDYNDLIFAFSNTTPVHNAPRVPEPLTLALMGTGLAGAFGARRIRKG